MKVSRNWLKTFFDSDIPSASELAELFTFHSFEVEGIEGDTIDVKILPDRAHYCLSHRGVAEEVHIVTGQPLRAVRDMSPTPLINPNITVPAVLVQTPFCRRYMSRRVSDVVVGESPEWMKKFLQEIGERSINNIVDATNFTMFDTGQPLHAFDADKIQGTIIVRAAADGEKIVLLDGREVALTASDHVIADDVGPLAIAGVKGGKRAQVTSETKSLVIEAANFNPTDVRRTATRLNLRNESSKRFENEITPELATDGMSMVSALIGGLVPSAASQVSEVIDIYPVKAAPTVITISRSYVNDRLGVDVPAQVFDDILARLGIVKNEHLLTIPHHRLDLVIPEDIVEEIGRVYGYEKIKTKLPSPSEKPISVLPIFYLSEKIKNILAAADFSEVNLYTLVPKGIVETAHPLASDKSFARANLTDGMMSCIEKNALNADLLGLTAVKAFEIGRAFSAAGETTMLALGVAQVKKIKNVKSEQVLAAAVELLSKELGLDVAVVGAMTPIISKGIHNVCQINLDEIAKVYQPQHQSLVATFPYADLGFGPAAPVIYKKFSAYPFIVRDIAVFTPESENDGADAVDVWAVIQEGIAEAGGDSLLAHHALFDTFKKDGKVSYAFRMVFQSMEKTLTDDAANTIMEKVSALVKGAGWEVR